MRNVLLKNDGPSYPRQIPIEMCLFTGIPMTLKSVIYVAEFFLEKHKSFSQQHTEDLRVKYDEVLTRKNVFPDERTHFLKAPQ